MRKIADEQIRPPTFVQREYPAALELIVMRALEKRRDDRYESGDALARDLETFLAEHATRTGEAFGNRQIAEYLQALDAPDAQVSVGGLRRAEAFLDSDDELDDELDLDAGGGAAWRLAGPVETAPAQSAPAPSLPVAVDGPSTPRPVAVEVPLTPPAVAQNETAAPAPVPTRRSLAPLWLLVGAGLGAVATWAALTAR
jgi:serine/threonine-protein kinase